MHKAALRGHTRLCEGTPPPALENRKETLHDGKPYREPQQQLQEPDFQPHQHQTTNSAANEHKHPNQYTKGADDESAKNSVNSRSAKNSR